MSLQTRIRIFDETVVVPVLSSMRTTEPRLDSLAARQLLVGTAVAESNLIHGLQQPNGPARSRFQIEPGTLRLIGTWLVRDPARHPLVRALARLLPPTLPPLPETVFFERFQQVPDILFGLADHLTFDDRFGCGLARLLYWSIPSPLPEAGDWKGQAAYWKAHYNTVHGKGTPEAYLARNAETLRYFETLGG